MTEALGGLRRAFCLKSASTPWRPTNRRTSAPGCTTTPLAGSTSSITARRRFLATAKATRSSKSFRQSRPNCRNQQADSSNPAEFMRHYYDIYELLQQPEVLKFISTAPYKQHKQARFRQADHRDIVEDEAFILGDAKTPRSTRTPMAAAARSITRAGRRLRRYLPRLENGPANSSAAKRCTSFLRRAVPEMMSHIRAEGNNTEADRLQPGAPAAITASFRCAFHCAAKIVESISYLKGWSEWQDSNLRPLRPERSALPG